MSLSRKIFSRCYTLTIGCIKIIKVEKLKFLQLLEFFKLFGSSFFAFYAISVGKSAPTYKIKSVGNWMYMLFNLSLMSKRLILTQLGVLMWLNTKTGQIFPFRQFVGPLDVWFFYSNQPYGLKERCIQLFSASPEFQKLLENSQSMANNHVEYKRI